MHGIKFTQEEYIEKCKKFNPEYDYSEINFTTIKGQFVTPICKKHGKFRVNAKGLMTKHIDCPECKREQRAKQFLIKAKEIHGNKYIYDLSTYNTNKTKIKIICPEHGEFWQAPGDHLKGWGCNKCSHKYKPTRDEWISKAAPVYNYKYDYSKVNYVDNKTPVTIICPEHGEFQSYPNNHLKGASGCPKCASYKRHLLYAKTTEQFINEARLLHGNKYDYSKVTYYNKSTKVCIICPEHGEFWQTPSSHLSGYGCPNCGYKNQGILLNKIKESFKDLEFISEFTSAWLGKQRIDIYCQKYNFGIEYDGEQQFYPINYFGGEDYFKVIKARDSNKNKKYVNNNCKLFRVKYGYTEEDYLELTDNIKNFIKDREHFIPKLRKGGNVTII